MRCAVKSALVIISVLLLTACQPTESPTPTPAPQAVGVTPLYLDWVSESLFDYLEDHEEANFTLDIYPPQAGLLAAEEAEIELLIGAVEAGEDAFVVPFFKDGIAVIHHPEIGVADLSMTDLRAIFAGRQQNWQAFGGDDLSIYPVIPLPGDDLRMLFQQKVMNDFQFSTLARLQASPDQILQLVAEQPGAVGFVPFSHLDTDSAVLRIEGQVVSLRSLESGRYPLSYWVVGIALDEPEGALRDWLSWVQAQQ